MDKKIKVITTTSSFKMGKFPEEFEVIHNPLRKTLTESEVIAFIEKEKPDGIIAGVEPLTKNVLEKSVTIKVISRCGVGLDSIDLVAANELGIKVLNTANEVIQSVSEMTVALALSLLRHIHVLDSQMKNNKWSKIQGRLLAGKTVGLVGCGRIGTQTAMLFKAFGCQIIGYDPYMTDHPECELVELSTLLESSDIVSLHLPAIPSTTGFVNESFLKQMKKTAFLLNTARGVLVNEEQLYNALKHNVIFGAGIDVFSEEPYSGKLMDSDIANKIILTPHVSSNTLEGRIQMEMKAVENLIMGLNTATY